MSKQNWLLGVVLVFGLGCATSNHDTSNEDTSAASSPKGSDFNYAQLQIKDLNEMQAVVNKQIKKADQFVKDEDDAQAITALQSALQYVLSRPNSDNMVSQLVPPIRSKLRELEAFEQALNNIVDIALFKINDKKLRPGARATNYFVLENFMSEFKPEVQVNENTKKNFMKIRDAKIELDSSVKSDLKMRAMYSSPKSPSDIAAKIIGPAK
jgi:hypothetical protein